MRKRILKNLVIATASCGIAATANAIGNGFYLGLMMGPATTKGPSLKAQIKLPQSLQDQCSSLPPTASQSQCLQTTSVDPRSTQFSSRIFMGNQFSRYAAFEGGVTFFSSIRYDAHDCPKLGGSVKHGCPTYGGTEQRVKDLDIVIKGIFPYKDTVDIYGKAGIAVTYITTGGALNPTYEPATNGNGQGHPPDGGHKAKLSGANEYKSKYSPTISVGASYAINQSWVMDASLNTVSIGNNVGTINFYSIGISYHFTDKYCGQFLCDD
jgi:hypothetical protein